MRGHYELTLSDGEKIQLRFCTWSLKRFCELQGIGITEIGEALSGENTLNAVINLLKASAEYPLYKQNITPSFTDIDVCDWIDEIGGITSPEFMKIMNVLAESMNSGLEAAPTKKGKGNVKKN